MDIPVSSNNKRFAKPWLKKGFVLAGLLVAAWLSTHFFDAAVPTVQQKDVWISKVQQGEFIREVRGVGVLVPSEIRWIAAESAGRVERVPIKPGAYVTKGTILAELSNPELVSQLQQAKWELDAAEANLLALEAQLQEQTLQQELYVTQAQMALESAKLKEQAERPLAEQHIISNLDFANTKLHTQQKHAELEIKLQTQARRADVVAAKLVAERAKVRKFQNLVNLFQSQMQALTITAGTEGVLQQISVDVGQRVNVGSNIAHVARPNSLMAELQVQENMVQDLQLNFPVTIDTRNGLVDGVLTRIDPRVQNGNVQIDVKLTGELPSGARPDLSVTGTIIVEQIANALYIDRPAGAAARSETQLFALTPEQDQAKLRNITLGKASVSSIQIIAGLQSGDTVIVSDMSEFDQHNVINIAQ